MAAPVKAVHDTLTVLVHDTTVVSDTLHVAKHLRFDPLAGVQPVHIYGWLVTLAGFVLAAFVARAGWRKTAEAGLAAQRARRELDDDNARKILRDAIREGLGVAIVLLPDIIAQLKRGAYLPDEIVAHLDEGRRAYDRNKDHMVHWTDAAEKDRIQLWFREANILRTYLDAYKQPVRADGPPIHIELLAGHIEAMERSRVQARKLYEHLGFPRVSPGEPGYEEWAPQPRKG